MNPRRICHWVGFHWLSNHLCCDFLSEVVGSRTGKDKGDGRSENGSTETIYDQTET